MAMMKKALVIENDQPTQLEIILTSHQSDGVYRYQPEPEDTAKLIIYNDENINIKEFDVDMTDPKYLFVNIDTTGIPEGKYKFRVEAYLASEAATYIVKENEPVLIRRLKENA